MNNKNEKININLFNRYFPKEMLQNLLNKCLNNRLTKLENSTKNQMLNLNKTSKNFKDFSKNIQQISNNYLAQTELHKDKLEKKDESKNNNINENVMKQSFKKQQQSKNNNNISNNTKNRSNTLGISKYKKLKKQNTEININKTSFISNNNNNTNRKKLKSIEKDNKNKNNNSKKDLIKNATPKKTNKIDFLIGSKPKYPQTEKINKKTKEMKKMNTNKNLKVNNRYYNDFENFYNDNNTNNKQLIRSFRKDKKTKIKNELRKNKTFYDKKITNLENENINDLKASFSQRKEKKLYLNEKIFNSVNNNNSNNLNDIQNIVKLVDNVNENITKILNNNNSVEVPLDNNLMNSANFPNEIKKKNEFFLKKKTLPKKERIKNINIFALFKKDNNIVKNILKYLTPKEAIYFYSVNNYFNKGRIIFFDSKKEELLSILNLKKDETIENKIIEIKNKFTKENLSNKKKFEITKETKEIIKKMNTEEYLNKLENIASDNNNENLIIIYKILFVLLNEENIYNILNKNIFWKKCIDFFKTNCPEGKVGDFILLKIPNFKFDIKEFNKIQKLLKGNKNQIINEISNNKDFLIMPLIKESLEYCGVIFSENKTEGNIYIKNLRKNQIMINYLNNLKVRYFLSKYNEEDEED